MSDVDLKIILHGTNITAKMTTVTLNVMHESHLKALFSRLFVFLKLFLNSFKYSTVSP